MSTQKDAAMNVGKDYPVPETQTFLPGTQIEVLHPDIERGNIKHCVFDFDGTVSILREGWPDIMLPVMVNAIRGETPATPELEQACLDYIDESTGIQTVLQMEHLVEMVREFGNVPEDQILDARGYKQIYNDALMEPVNARLAALRSGEKTLEDATVLKSRDFVKALYDRGVTVYIASGTDRDDVINECGACEIAQWAKGGIWGAIGNVEEYSKDKVIKQIIADNALHGSELLVVGDGPVEIRNAKSNGGIAVGVASDEVAGQGWNMDKRPRLVKAGCDILVPDFGEMDAILRYLFEE